jgi:hypothetical protein
LPAAWSFRGTWRHYQQLGLDAFEADRAAGRTKTPALALGAPTRETQRRRIRR